MKAPHSGDYVGPEATELVEIPDLSDDEWEALVERLALYADSKLRKLYWRGVSYSEGGSVPGGVCPGDLAAQAIESFLDGSRNWDESKQPELVEFLMDVIDSKVSHLVESAENRKTRRIDTTDRTREPAFRVKAKSRRPDQIVADNELRERIRTTVMAELDGDELAESVFECFEAEITKPKEIAELLGVETSEVNNAKKRLCRATDKAFQKLGRSRP